MPHRLPTWSEVHAQGPSPTALALRDWLMAPARQPGPHEPDAFVDGLARLLAVATVEDCIYAAFEFDPARSPLYGKLVEQGVLASIELCGGFPPAAAHRAVCVGWIDDRGTRAWVDGVELPLPRDEEGRPRADPQGTGWWGQRWYFIEIGGLYGHPRSDPADLLRLGTVRGLLVWDAQRRAAHVEYPRDDERWTSPGASVQGGCLLIHASRAGMNVEAPARTIPLDVAFAAAA
jgi:hypothetical protein